MDDGDDQRPIRIVEFEDQPKRETPDSDASEMLQLDCMTFRIFADASNAIVDCL
jgi:hypothetical protein